MNDNVFQLNDFLKELKPEYSKIIASQTKRIMFLLDERSFIPQLTVCTDVDMLKAIFSILINNAIKYTDKGYIKTGYRILEDDTLQFFIEDTGNGFDPETLEKITGIIATDGSSANGHDGTLAAATRMVKTLGGKMRIESQKRMGTTVYFSTNSNHVNAETSETEEARENVTSAPQKDANPNMRDSISNIWAGKTILIAEDEIVNYMFLEVLFEETGAILLHAADGRQAIDIVKENPGINIVLMDIKMPNINGLDATRHIKTIRPQLPIIAQTAYAMQDDEYKALQAGCNDYISNPLDALKLTNIMKKYL
jgi:CheY-like chemotaxis protein